MDETVTGALEALGVTSATAKQWRDTLRQVHEETQRAESPDDWNAFTQRLTYGVEYAGLPMESAQRFLEFAAQTYGVGLVEHVVMLTDEEFGNYCAYAGWQRLITEHGADWAAYDGSPEHWAYFRDQFYTQAYALDPQVYAMLHEQLHPYEEAPPLERYYALQALGLPVNPSAAESAVFAEPAVPAALDGPGSFDEMTVEDIEQMILAHA
ncbi:MULTISPECIES: hypothetical protein [unclassified Streptomyces]|uniref:hypothetical protein n=1 Tax=unclassified Streptomyces TaxID=2593676 RepID=UPI00344EC25A